MDLGFTWFDIGALAILGLSGVMAFARGLIREVFSIIAFIGGGLGGFLLGGMVAPLVEAVTNLRGGIAALAGGLAIFLIIYIVITIIISSVAKTAHQSAEIGGFDRSAGLAFGILRGVLVVALGVLCARTWLAEIPDSMANARTYPVYESVAKAFEQLFPKARQRARAIIEDRRQRDSSEGETTTTAPEPASN